MVGLGLIVEIKVVWVKINSQILWLQMYLMFCLSKEILFKITEEVVKKLNKKEWQVIVVKRVEKVLYHHEI